MKKIVSTVVYEFNVSDIDSPEIYATNILWEWANSEIGKWVKSKSLENPQLSRIMDHESYSYKYKILSRMYEEDALCFTLKYK